MDSSGYYTSAPREAAIRLAEKLEGSKVTASLETLTQTAAMSRDALLEFQWKKLRRLLEHAYTNVPYYRRVFDDAGITPEGVRGMDDFRRIPLLTKDLIRENLADLQATRLPAGLKVVTAQTGGTTGEPLKFLRDADCNSFTRAALLRSYRWTGYRLGDPMLFLTGGSLLGAPQTIKQRAAFGLMNYHFMPGFRLRRDTLGEFVDVVRKHGVKFLRGYSTLLHAFADLCEKSGYDDIHLTGVYPTAEMLTDAQRRTIERVFHTNVYDHYGCAEINSLANECPEGRKSHIIEEHVLMERVDTDQHGADSIVLTDLDNFAQPFIRYANGDRGRISEAPCECGRNLAVLEEFLGRSSDDIVLAGGERYPGVFFHHLFGHFDGVTQFQAVQDTAGQLSVRIIRNDRFADDDAAEIRRLIKEHTGIDAELDFTDAIERKPGAKITSVICRVSED